MSEPLINWEKLKPYDRTQYRSFEELCYRIATGLYGDKGTFTPIDDSGGGDGVEFYLTLPNGEQWGWQAKFYPDGRLNNSRKESIKKSLRTAHDNHPTLRKWILCTPKKLTPDEQSWFDKKLVTSKVKGSPVVPPCHSLQLENWVESDFISWMSEERFSGIRLFFFGELELSLDWFKRLFAKQMQGVRDRFDPLLHTETGVDESIHQVLGDYKFVQQVERALASLSATAKDFEQRIHKIRQGSTRPVDPQIALSILSSAIKQFNKAFHDVFAQFESVRDLLIKRRYDLVKKCEWGPLLSQLKEAYSELQTAFSSIVVSSLPFDGNKEYEASARDDARRELRAALEPAAQCVGEADELIYRLGTLTKSDLHIFGDAGLGKTHLACNICHEHLEASLPAILILGVHCTGEAPLERQLLDIMDIPPSYSWNDFLQALAVAAQVYRTRIPFVIEGLNEATRNGAFSPVWRLGLPGVTRELSQVSDVVLITTCRTSYRQEIWPPGGPANTIQVRRFDYSELDEAITKYFRAYRISADLTAAFLEQFRSPIYLKIFCEAQNPDRKEDKYIHIGEQTLFEVFDKYLQQCNQALCRRLKLRSSRPIVLESLQRFAAYLWEYKTRRAPISVAVDLIDRKPVDELNWETSKTHTIESEGLLVCRDWGREEEEFFFTYDLLGGYLIASHLINQYRNDLSGFLNSEATKATLYSQDRRQRHPLHEDIRRSFAALLPLRSQKYLHNLIDDPVAFRDSIRALFEISPEAIDANCVELVSDLFKVKSNRRYLLDRSAITSTSLRHPLGWKFWHQQLMGLSMAERDASWTEYLRAAASESESAIIKFQARCRSRAPIPDIDKPCLHLSAMRFMWMLTSTVRPLRDKSTRALYWYGRHFPEPFFDLVLDSFGINDPYVSERMLAATHGIAMARQYDFNDPSFAEVFLPKWGRELYEKMFAENAPFGTTHILARDYARRTIDIALNHHPGLLNNHEKQRITPPFKDGGLRQWGESGDLHPGKYANDADPIQMDFGNYTLGRLVKDRRNYDYENPEYKRVLSNIYWRLYNLGYSPDLFTEIDSSILRVNAYRARTDDLIKTDRYGKKYSWIAYYELAGYLENQEVPQEDTWFERFSDADIDPSFPEELPTFNLVRADFLGDRSVSTAEWVRDGGVPNVEPYLIVPDLLGEKGPWILLDGHVDQEDEENDRNRFTFLRTLLVATGEAEEIARRLTSQDLGNRWLPEKSETHFAYAGEIPWCDTYRLNDWDDLPFTESGDQSETPEYRVVRPGQGLPLDNSEMQAFVNELRPLLKNQDRAAYEDLLRKWGVEIKVEMKAQDEERGRFKALVPVRECGWGGSRTAVYEGHTATVPAKQIAQTLNLCGQPQTYDFFTPEGSRASVTFSYDGERGHSEHFTYLRQDILDEYLRTYQLKLIWAIWGERQHSVSRMSMLGPAYRPGSGEQPWRVFQQITTYDELLLKASNDKEER